MVSWRRTRTVFCPNSKNSRDVFTLAWTTWSRLKNQRFDNRWPQSPLIGHDHLEFPVWEHPADRAVPKCFSPQ